MRGGLVRRWMLVALVLLGLLGGPTARAEGPDYTLPGAFALPWECGQGHRVSWEPQDHWEQGKATGIAYDFAMQEGTPLYAPMNGWAVFLRDERPFETNLGNYIEIVDESGDWLVRLAHLRNEQQGERYVRAGELVGYSGASGVSSPHLHLELLVREGESWVRPDPTRLTSLFGLTPAELTMDALITNLSCPALLTLVEEVTFVPARVPLGESVELKVSVQNQGLAPLRFDLLQLVFYSTEGDVLLAEAEGDWSVQGKDCVEIGLGAHPPSAGTWYVGRLTYRTEQGVMGTPARGALEVAPSPLRQVGLGVGGGALSVGDVLRLYVWVENQGEAEVRLEGLFAEGVRPDGVPWRASSDVALTLAPGEVQRVLLETNERLAQVGAWSLERLGYVQDGREQLFATLERTLNVQGPQLVVEKVELFPSSAQAHIFVQVRNVGTALAQPEAIEIWGWKPGGESFGEQTRQLAPLEAGQAALLQFDIPVGVVDGLWKLVEAGYWQEGSYYRMALPTQPAIAVSALPMAPPPMPAEVETPAPRDAPRSPGEGLPAPR